MASREARMVAGSIPAVIPVEFRRSFTGSLLFPRPQHGFPSVAEIPSVGTEHDSEVALDGAPVTFSERVF